MFFFNILTLLGGLALFLYGMDVMGGALSKTSGNQLEHTLEKLTTNKYRGVLLGAAITAVIQSSSGTTVMVVGLVNSGIMRLTQAVGVIMGANIGTTVTSWLLSLTGLESSNFFVKLLKPSSFSPVLAFVGICIMMISKNKRRKNIALIMVGFAILMFGMETMSQAMAPLAQSERFSNILLLFSNPIAGMLLGALLTAIIQSSSASVGMLQALCATGAVTYAIAFPIIMGQNIGTCITAILSSIGTTTNAKRAACIHLYFNLIGTIVFMIIFYGIHFVSPLQFLNNSANSVGIAIVHSSFNITATLLLLPFSAYLEKLARLTIKSKELDSLEEIDQNEFKLLDQRFLNQPTFAIEQVHQMLIRMVRYSHDTLIEAMRIINDYKDENYNNADRLEKKVDRYEDVVGSYMVKLSSRELTDKDSKKLTIMMHCIDDFERISDHAMSIAHDAKDKHEDGFVFSDQAQSELAVFFKTVTDLVDLSIDVFTHLDRHLALHVEPLQEVVDQMSRELSARHIERLQNGQCSINIGLAFTNIMTTFEHISDHCTNMALSILQMSDNRFDRHEYMSQLRQNKHEFAEIYRVYSEKYVLPEDPYLRQLPLSKTPN